MSRRFMLVCAAALLLGSAPADARVVDRVSYSDSDTFTDEPCGYPLEVSFSSSGQVVVRDTKGGEAFRARDTGSFEVVFTNPENGKWFRIYGHTTINEVKARQVDGNTYKFTDHEAGLAFVLEDSSGTVLVRDRGLVQTTYLFDTLGDGEPGGEEIEVLNIRLAGPHPAFAEDFPFCELVDSLVL